ncbi:DUF2339 domain-containing protein [Aggregatimonas sangjinii]|uniref:DUF2339 domain-containing protein n=1 Tax=Aggregatimonas sangjinii TaxID=2583587 RepID=A0A5B7SVM1_9FLAO|nr:DUF2339 domain-containing protein [Aggregatimonas sangjinii]QCX00704.1 DUF2339 domain-containing protein [Aggregatimonas sangjinii]
MADHQDRIDQLNQKLEILLSKQEGFAKELMALYREIELLKKQPREKPASEQKAESIPPETLAKIDALGQDEKQTEIKPTKFVSQTPVAPPIAEKRERKPKSKSNWEKFVGENLINKIGIAILVIGVAIGAKYSIENNLISPLTRIILGYFAGLGLLGFGIKLKTKYENYSAVLVSGALAILYFITFAAYSFYGLFPQLIAFGLMLLFTAFGVVAALHYNKQVIAHIGLVGSYAVPFLLSNDSGNAAVLLSYIAIINLGILIIAFKKYWKPLYYSAFVFTWLIYSVFSAFSYETEKHFPVALFFLCVFFLLFYGIFLAFKLRANEKFGKSDVVMLLLNSFIFFGLGYNLLTHQETGKQLLGVFTLCNAIVHFVVSAFIYRKKLADRNLFYLVSGLVLVFITIAVPVQLDGNWVTLLWAMEAALLFWIGRTKNVPVYEYLSYPLMLLAVLSLTHDWGTAYSTYYQEDFFMSIFNIDFLSSMLFVAAFGFINYIHQKTDWVAEVKDRNWLQNIMAFGMPIILLLSLYGAIYLEIEYYFDKLFRASEIPVMDGSEISYSEYNYELKDFGAIWLLNYTLFFIAALALANIKFLKNRILGIATLLVGVLATLLFLAEGLYLLSEIRQSLLNEDLSSYGSSSFNIGIRYVALAFFALLLFALFRLGRATFMRTNLRIPFEFVLHLSILWILSSELLQWMDLAGSTQSYKLGLSILWGVYALFLIALGIYKNKKYLRMGAIALFAITLVKLFFYDIASMNTITKTVVFVSLGILLLIISFLYNKYKHKIADEPHEE